MTDRMRMAAKPHVKRQGEIACFIPSSLVTKRDELALSLALVCHRRLFGLCYLGLQPDYFFGMPLQSGVLIRPIIPTRLVATEEARPGDIDLLVIPYEEDELVLGRALAIEVKAIRATFLRQGRSPNDFGFSQANALAELGFPYTALAHLIVSDTSPPDAWREISAARILDSDGRVSPLFKTNIDMMPADLIERAFGRLERNCKSPDIGLAAAYIEAGSFAPSGGHLPLWTPETRPAVLNARSNDGLLERVGALYESAPEAFIAVPRYDPYSAPASTG